jgi:hypothetical protein
MAMPLPFKIGWVQVTLIGFLLLTDNWVWFYFHEWQAIKNWPGFDYHLSVARRLLSFSGLALFLGGLTFGAVRSAYRLLRRLLSRGPDVL